ncbi:MAG: hypothetical protein ACLFNO_00935 [Parcubacteria group bacterium]
MKKSLYFIYCFLLLSMLLVFKSCKKEIIVEEVIVYIQDAHDDGVYVLSPEPEILGNLEIKIWPSYTSTRSRIEVDNRLQSPLGFILRSKEDEAFVYYEKKYIKPEGRAESGNISSIPFNKQLSLTIVVYNSTVSYAFIELIESLGLDYWDSIADYKDNLQTIYQRYLVIEK